MQWKSVVTKITKIYQDYQDVLPQKKVSHND